MTVTVRVAGVVVLELVAESHDDPLVTDVAIVIGEVAVMFTD